MARLLSLMKQLQEMLERCGLSGLLEKPSELEAMLVRYKAMQASFEKSGFSELFEDTDRLDKFLETHRQVRSSFQAAGFENLLDDAAAAEQFFQQRQAFLSKLFKALLRPGCRTRKLQEWGVSAWCRDSYGLSSCARDLQTGMLNRKTGCRWSFML
ncbi:unnamed protein product [Symbiodinium necroappetens]|uniref:Uncharacterized protein n=1 Tax=Symbiodinium necroappetens TaxID=1628268 RepID=A0A813C7B8_9DINO|nr:unnamed protein product [Symbiodinium necroappetens]